MVIKPPFVPTVSQSCSSLYLISFHLFAPAFHSLFPLSLPLSLPHSFPHSLYNTFFAKHWLSAHSEPHTLKMHYHLILAALAALGTASPTVQPIDINAILAATAPSLTGPPALATGQTGVYNAAAASSIASAAVTGVASASATQSVVARDVLERRGFCILWFCIGTQTSSTSTSKSSTKAVSSTSCSSTTSATVTATTTPAAVTTSAATITTAPSTCTPVSWTNTFAFTTATGCAQPFEVGTYCGFINPEDPCAVQPDGES